MEKQNKFGIRVGDIFHSQYGWNTVRHAFYKVVAINGTTQVTVKELKTRVVSDDGYGQQGNLVMVDEFEDNPHYNRELKKSVQRYRFSNDDEYYIRISNYENAYLMKPEEYNNTYWFDYMD